MRRLLVNDCLTTMPNVPTFWHLLAQWFSMEFVGGDYAGLGAIADAAAHGASLIVRNATYFPPLAASCDSTNPTGHGVPTISLLQDIIPEGPQRTMQEAVIESSRVVVFNSLFTQHAYALHAKHNENTVIPLPVDFRTFEIGNAMGLQRALALPSGAVCWVGACMNSAGLVKGYDIFLSIVRANPDIPFVAVFKDRIPDSIPPNMRAYCRISQTELAQVMGACRIGLCTSRSETQHLAGIEMGACGLPMVAPPVGVYAGRDNLPGIIVQEPSIPAYTAAIRAARQGTEIPESIRAYWMKEFHPEIVKVQWAALIASVEKQ